MQFSYRGAKYDREPSTLEVREGEIGGKYRGQEWKYHYPRHVDRIQPPLNFNRCYRGVPYNNESVATNDLNVSIQRQMVAKCYSRSTKPIAAKFMDETNKIHLDNMRRNLERRLQVAKSIGDSHLVNLLQEESKQLALNS